MPKLKGNHKINKEALEKQIAAVETAIREKIKARDLRGINSLQKKLTKLWKEWKRYKYL